MNHHPLNMFDVIQRGSRRPETLCCPWCGSDPLPPEGRAGRYLFGCDNEDCTVRPQTGGATPEEAVRKWNQRK